MRCVTLMVNRSDRRFPTLSAAMAREAARLISRTKRAEVHQGPGPHLTPDKQAGYMTATEFQNRVCNSTLARGRGPYMAGGARRIRTLGVTRNPFDGNPARVLEKFRVEID